MLRLAVIILLNVLSMSDSDEINWTNCIICLEATPESLRCPGKNAENTRGYYSFANIFRQLHELNELPNILKNRRLTKYEEEELVELFQSKNARWHPSCRLYFSKSRVERAMKKKKNESTNHEKSTRRRSFPVSQTVQSCFFCDETNGDLHLASTFQIDKNVRHCANVLNDGKLIAKLSVGDMISQDAVYHTKCLTSLYNKVRPSKRDDTIESMQQSEGIALAELCAYVEEFRATDDPHVFQLADLVKLYSKRIEQLSGMHSDRRVNSTHLKNKLLAHIPDLQAYKHGRNTLLAFNQDIGAALYGIEDTSDEDAFILTKCASIIRREMQKHKSIFNGTFSEENFRNAVPQSLEALVDMLLRGTNIERQNRQDMRAPVYSISQLVFYNYVHHTPKGNEKFATHHHSTDREPPLPVYLGMKLHAETRKRGLVENFHSLGLSVSYDRVLAISTALGNHATDRYHEEGLVCPPQLRSHIFTTSAVDNIDHNPSSNTSQGSLHGTGISVFQHPRPGSEGDNMQSEFAAVKLTSERSLRNLPDSYIDVLPIQFGKHPPISPSINDNIPQALYLGFSEEKRWLDHGNGTDHAETDQDNVENYSWSAYHASMVVSQLRQQKDSSVLLPLFQEQAHSPAMMRHSMDVIRGITNHLNAGQTPVLACDQPLYALAKAIQWTWPDIYGEHQFVIMLGGLHIEMAFLRLIGDWLDESGWVAAIVKAGIASQGTAESFLKAVHVSKTRHSHQVSAKALYILMMRAYDLEQDGNQQFDDWKTRRELESPQFKYWSLTLQLEISCLVLVKSFREGNFELYRNVLVTLVRWFFALDKTNYARWLPVHIRDMFALDQNHPEVKQEFDDEKFVVNKTLNVFSALPLDHAHEQNNKLVKGDGGAIGLTENSCQLLRWMVSGPEVARVIDEFQTVLSYKADETSNGHHEQKPGVQNLFRKQVSDLVSAIEEFGNPFTEDSTDLLVLDTRDIMQPSVSTTLQQIELNGKQQYQTFVDERLIKRSKSIYDPISRNKYSIFGCRPTMPSVNKNQISSLKQNCALFSRLYISCQVRNGDLDEFFRHENQTCPPSLSKFGQLRPGNKSDLIQCLQQDIEPIVTLPSTDVLLIDGAALVNMLQTGATRTFQEYADEVFVPYINSQLQKFQRIDIVWDRYFDDSLKGTAREARGKGKRRRVAAQTCLPGKWSLFLRNDENKTELFRFLAEELTKHNFEKEIISTYGENILHNLENDSDVYSLCPCNHEEADTRLFLHLSDVSKTGYESVSIRTVDTDVLVLAIAFFPLMSLQELWIILGSGKHIKYIPVHDVVQHIGRDKAVVLPAFHAFTGCDQTSFFSGIGKKTAWHVWNLFPDLTAALEVVGNRPSPDDILEIMPILERFVVLIYDKTNESPTVNEARKDLFTRKNRTMDCIPPSAAALIQHVRRVAYQAGHVWSQSIDKLPELPSSANWGWRRDEQIPTWIPVWSSLPTAADSCKELIKCGCSPDKGCRGRCKCVRAEMPCTLLCKCGGQCDRD